MKLKVKKLELDMLELETAVLDLEESKLENITLALKERFKLREEFVLNEPLELELPKLPDLDLLASAKISQSM